MFLSFQVSNLRLLGAVRHGGFIPWDDDVDIEMLKEEFDKFLSVLPEELSKDYVLHSYANDPYFIHSFIKIREKKIDVPGVHPLSQKYNQHGCFVDVFPIQKMSKFSSKISKSLFSKLLWKPLRKYDLGLAYITMVRFLLVKIIFPLLSLLSFCGEKAYFHSKGSAFRKPRKKEYLTQIKRIEFEGVHFNAPLDTHGYLTDLYGDYLDFPENKQSHLDIAKRDHIIAS